MVENSSVTKDVEDTERRGGRRSKNPVGYCGIGRGQKVKQGCSTGAMKTRKDSVIKRVFKEEKSVSKEYAE